MTGHSVALTDAERQKMATAVALTYGDYDLIALGGGVVPAVESILAARVRQAEAKVERVEALADVEAMERAMFQSSGMREDLLPLAAVAASAAIRAALVGPSTGDQS